MTKLGHAFRLANRYANVDSAKRFALHVVPEVVRPAQIVWNQAIGAVFLLFAVSFLWYAIAHHKQNPAGMIFGIFLSAVMGFFSFSSFLKARHIARR